jgi:SEC-C motif-containing protein
LKRRSLHPQSPGIDSTSRRSTRLDLREKLVRTVSDTEWTRLTILDTEGGLEDDEHGEVEFVAGYRESGVAKQLHERSTFVREGGRWFYVSGKYENLRPLPKPGRNEPCWCGSGKKFKKCHGR